MKTQPESVNVSTAIRTMRDTRKNNPRLRPTYDPRILNAMTVYANGTR